eukprot:6779424-Pyramimonas_sp.AAC.1
MTTTTTAWAIQVRNPVWMMSRVRRGVGDEEGLRMMVVMIMIMLMMMKTMMMTTMTMLMMTIMMTIMIMMIMLTTIHALAWNGQRRRGGETAWGADGDPVA